MRSCKSHGRPGWQLGLSMSEPFEEQSYETASDFLAALRPSNDEWEGDDETDTGWAFRGQSNSDWRLRPNAFRISRCNPLLIRFLRRTQRERTREGWNWIDWVQPETVQPASIDSAVWERRIASASLHAFATAWMVREFILLAGRAGHPTDFPGFLWHLFNQAEHRGSFGSFFHGKITKDDMVAFAIAQHHRIPTGLLDWTHNPLVAAFFAGESPAKSKSPKKGSRFAVWALRLAIFKRDQKELRRLTVPPGQVRFLDAQDGLFIWQPKAYETYLLDGRFPTLEELVPHIASSTASAGLKLPLLRKLTLPVGEAGPLLKLLWRERITRAHLMPTYDNVADSLLLKSTWWRDTDLVAAKEVSADRLETY